MTVGGGGGGGGEGMSSMRDCVSEFTPGAIALAKLAATACAGAGTGWLPAHIPKTHKLLCECCTECNFLRSLSKMEAGSACLA